MSKSCNLSQTFDSFKNEKIGKKTWNVLGSINQRFSVGFLFTGTIQVTRHFGHLLYLNFAPDLSCHPDPSYYTVVVFSFKPLQWACIKNDDPPDVFSYSLESRFFAVLLMLLC